MGLFDINTNLLASDLLPYEKRTVVNKGFVISLLSSFTRRWNLLIACIQGAETYVDATLWVAGTYTIGQYVLYMPTGAVYECLVASTSTIPSTSTDWLKVLDSFIGSDETQNFTGGKLSLEYALNRRFYGDFQQPSTGLTSDIYFVYHALDAPFTVGYDSGSEVSYENISTLEGVSASNTTDNPIMLTIYIPDALYFPLGSTDAQRDTVIQKFTNKYIKISITYNIIHY